MTVLVTGGAGYIGLHMCLGLIDEGESVVVLDNLSTGDRNLIPPGAKFECSDASDTQVLSSVIERYDIDAVVSFAGSAVVSDSIAHPLSYYENNTVLTLNLIRACVSAGIPIIFSSTAAVYGITEGGRISEEYPKLPLSPYGRSKLVSEWMLQDAAAAHGLSYAILRYFNVAGADPNGRAGQPGQTATHLIKVACDVALGRRDSVTIYGDDYATPDGTGIRDYVHVTDLIHAHHLALRFLRAGAGSMICNCGYGKGYSVREVIAAVERVAGKQLKVNIGPRRAGDAPMSIANNARIRRTLGWTARYDNLDYMVQTAYDWEKRKLVG